ncbi:hypothetical protein [Aeromonas eucrenophila]|uniref:Chemotaxis protein n=1 Tax=Aeromonas eucrenophila TaxID=649 RepID=A0ABW0YDV7_9GAMM|nr:hypothetical protein [Aeromonas eucrenophila]
MPLPFILGAAAIAAAGFGAKKGYDGYQDKSLANDILEGARSKYEKAKDSFDTVNEQTTTDLELLGSLQLKIGSDFKEFRKLSNDILAKINAANNKDIAFTLPKHKLVKIDELALSTTAYLGKIAGAGVGGAAAAYAVYGGVMALAAASTGTPIAALSGVAAYNAAMAAIGGGSLAAGGFGMAGGAMVLGSVVAAPIIAIAGWAYASHAEEALKDARSTRDEANSAVDKLERAKVQLEKTSLYVNKIHHHTNHLYQLFVPYFDMLKYINNQIITRGSIAADELKEDAIRTIENGMQLASILTDIITTPLFKPKMDSQGKVIINDDNIPQFDTNENGMQVLNEAEINSVLDSAK